MHRLMTKHLQGLHMHTQGVGPAGVAGMVSSSAGVQRLLAAFWAQWATCEVWPMQKSPRSQRRSGGDFWQYQTQAWLCSLHSQVSPEQIFMPPLSFSSWLLCFKGLFVVPQLTAYSSWLFTADSLSGSFGYLVHLCCLHCHAFLSSCWPSHFAKGEM